MLLTGPMIRPYVRSIIERFRGQTVVMSQNEVHPKARSRQRSGPARSLRAEKRVQRGVVSGHQAPYSDVSAPNLSRVQDW